MPDQLSRLRKLIQPFHAKSSTFWNSNFSSSSKILLTDSYHTRVDVMDDDLDDYKLDTTWGQDSSYVVHTTLERDHRHRGHTVRVEKKWYRQKELGVGSCGIVHLETTKDGRQRAVKSVRKSLAERLRIDYRRELAALTTFSKAKVNHNFLLRKICL
jgi:hypothetical protein